MMNQSSGLYSDSSSNSSLRYHFTSDRKLLLFQKDKQARDQTILARNMDIMENKVIKYHHRLKQTYPHFQVLHNFLGRTSNYIISLQELVQILSREVITRCHYNRLCHTKQDISIQTLTNKLCIKFPNLSNPFIKHNYFTLSLSLDQCIYLLRNKNCNSGNIFTNLKTPSVFFLQPAKEYVITSIRILCETNSILSSSDQRTHFL